MNQALSFPECKRNFSRKQFPKKVACSLEYCVVIIVYYWSLSLSSSKEIEKKDTAGQNPSDINITTILAFHHIMKLEKSIVG